MVRCMEKLVNIHFVSTSGLLAKDFFLALSQSDHGEGAKYAFRERIMMRSGYFKCTLVNANVRKWSHRLHQLRDALGDIPTAIEKVRLNRNLRGQSETEVLGPGLGQRTTSTVQTLHGVLYQCNACRTAFTGQKCEQRCLAVIRSHL